MIERSTRAGRFGRLFLVLAGVLTAAVVAAAVLLTRPFAESSWIEAVANPADIYVRSDARDIPVVSPFHLEIQPMRALLLVNFENDPDRIYRGLKPQAFDDDVHGRGLIVIGWRVDGHVDVFHDPAVRLDPATYGIAGKGLHAMVPRDFTGARLELRATGAQADFDFPDHLAASGHEGLRPAELGAHKPG